MTSTTSPIGIALVEQMEERRTPPTPPARRVPTDIFVLSLGEPDQREQTKIAGLPYWPAGREWPTNADGEPLTFIAQFNFLDSMDITGPLPGEILLIFGDHRRLEDGEWYDDPLTLTFLWMDRGDVALIASDDMPPAGWPIQPCYGSIHRSFDLCNHTDDDHGSGWENEDDATPGIKIGGLPAFIQGGEYLTKRFLAQLGSDASNLNLPWPYLNVEGPMTWPDGAEPFIWGDGGNLYLFLDDDGSIRWEIDCH